MRVPIDEIKSTLNNIIATRTNLTPEEADMLATDYLEGELQGKKTHGLTAFTSMVPMLSKDRKALEIVTETDAYIYIDAHNDFGAIVGRRAADMLIAKAKKQGVGLALIKNMKSWLRPGSIAQYTAQKDMVGFVVNTGGMPMVAPPGGKEPVVGTNPIGIGIPSGDAPLVADMATSKRAWGEVRLAQKFGHELPADGFLDDAGNVTTDPNKAQAALPMGGYKGFALGLFIEMLGGSLVGMPMGKDDSKEDYRTSKRGAMILVINPAMAAGTEQFKQQNAEFIEAIEKTAPAAGSEGVTISGERSSKLRQENLERGYLEVDDGVWGEIRRFVG